MNTKVIKHFLANAKAYVALVGSALVVLLGHGLIPAQYALWAQVVVAVAAVVAVWRVPNTAANVVADVAAGEQVAAAVKAAVAPPAK